MKNIITLIESELHRRALQAISEEKQGVAKKAFDVPELHEDGDDDNIGEALEPDGAEGEEAKSKQKKNVEGKRQDVKGGKDETAEDEDILTAATTGATTASKEVQMQNVQGKRRETEITR